MIIQPNGTPYRGVLPMAARHIQAMCDGAYFVEHPNLLREIHVELVCKHCAAAGTYSALRFISHDDRLEFRCAHQGGHLLRHRDIDQERLCAEAGWTYTCTDCQTPVTGDNDQTAPYFTVTCHCRTRSCPNPLYESFQQMVAASGRPLH